LEDSASENAEEDAESPPADPHAGLPGFPAATSSSASSGEDAEAVKTRMLAAMIPAGERYWFFKITGPPEDLERHAEAFTDLIESIEFPDGQASPPTWDLPEEWEQEPGTGMRLATIKLDPEKSELEISVIPLGLMGNTPEAYELSNINRWRGQVGLPPITAEQVVEETTAIELDGTKAIVVDVTGKAAPAGMRPPFMGGAGMGRAPGGPDGN